MKLAFKRKYIVAFCVFLNSGEPAKETFIQIVKAYNYDEAMELADQLYNKHFEHNDKFPDGEFKVIDYKEGKLLSVGYLW